VTATAPTVPELHGPVDFVLLEFPRDRLTGEPSRALVDLVESGVIRLYDLLVISKEEDGTVEVLELGDPSVVSGFAYFSGARSGLLNDDDVADASSAMQPGTVAALIVYENTWAIPFVEAARSSGGELIASARIPAPVVMEALEAMDDAGPEAGGTSGESA
jgi:hypothetical protein